MGVIAALPPRVRRQLDDLLVRLNADPRVRHTRLFGSFARGSGTPISDLDVMIIVDHPSASFLHGVCVRTENDFELDLALFSEHRIHQIGFDPYTSSCLLPNSIPLTSRCEICERAASMGASGAAQPDTQSHPMELANLTWHVEHILGL